MRQPTFDPPLECPRLLLAHPDPRYVARTTRAFQELGWEVYTARSALEVRRLARKLDPTVVLLAAELWEESGWLTCDKLVRQNADLKVFLVDRHPTTESRQFADFVGAAGLLEQEEYTSVLVEEALGSGGAVR